MTTLKTLKDLEKEIDEEMSVNGYDVSEDGEDIVIRELRQEAIKWVKELRCPMENPELGYFEVDAWIKYFFNLTEEDLK